MEISSYQFFNLLSYNKYFYLFKDRLMYSLKIETLLFHVKSENFHSTISNHIKNIITRIDIQYSLLYISCALISRTIFLYITPICIF